MCSRTAVILAVINNYVKKITKEMSYPDINLANEIHKGLTLYVDKYTFFSWQIMMTLHLKNSVY